MSSWCPTTHTLLILTMTWDHTTVQVLKYINHDEKVVALIPLP